MKDDNVVIIEKKIKIHSFKSAKIICYKIDTCTFYFEPGHFMSQTVANEGKHRYHEVVLKELPALLSKKDTVDLTKSKENTVVSSLVNDALEKGYVNILFSGKLFSGKTIINVEYWDKDVLLSEFKNSNLYRPDSDVFTLLDGELIYYYKPALKRSEPRFRD
ncbi:MAG TPA: hypothetical protein VK766_03825 [Cytophagaceae bacterium]|jgi:hypothetical protein|nr:hypothetical protein [Cytophagaceae bacterium]